MYQTPKEITERQHIKACKEYNWSKNSSTCLKQHYPLFLSAFIAWMDMYRPNVLMYGCVDASN